MHTVSVCAEIQSLAGMLCIVSGKEKACLSFLDWLSLKVPNEGRIVLIPTSEQQTIDPTEAAREAHNDRKVYQVT